MGSMDNTTGAQTMSAEELDRAIAKAKADLSDAQAAKRAARASAGTKRTPRPCACGCQTVTSGGTFAPGHDARHRGNLLRLIRAGGDEGVAALAELRKYPALTHGVGEEELGRDARTQAAKDERAAARKAEQLARLTAKLAASKA